MLPSFAKSMLSLKNLSSFYLYLYIVISTAQTDLGLISRTFSLKINRFSTFSEINQGWQC